MTLTTKEEELLKLMLIETEARITLMKERENRNASMLPFETALKTAQQAIKDEFK